MAKTTVAPYGSWKSPITSELIVSEAIRLGGGFFEGDEIYWLEGRPSEGGRIAIVKYARGQDPPYEDLIPPPYNARSRVHEYGGGSVVAHGGTIYFSNYADQRLYQVVPGGEPAPVTPEGPFRYADGVIDEARQRMICIREDHSGEEVVNAVVAIPLDGEGALQEVLFAGHDFYATPRLSPDGRSLAWLAWNHPNMPWDETELWLGDVQPDGTLSNTRRIAGGNGESIFQPAWSPKGRLYFVSDRRGWWNLYRLQGGEIEPVVEMEAEFGMPQWVFGMSTYAFESEERIICAYTREGIWHLAALARASGELTPIETPYTDVSSVQARPGQVLVRGGAPTRPGALIHIDLASGDHEILQKTHRLALDSGYLSTPESIEFPTTLDEEPATAYGLFYPPQNKDFAAPEGAKPPLLVLSHGGPTSATSRALSLRIQYWTSRGFAVLDVNYGGSTGYGRAYRERLKGRWGIVDVDDCANGARYLVEQGKVDPDRLAIRGGSAGGYTTLSAMAFRDVFRAGASHYGVGDLEALAQDTHKFESRYLDRLIGPYPERRDLYVERSPIHNIEGLNCPIIFFQGLEDKVVPPNQAEAMVEALSAEGLPVAYVPFAGEQHGFRRAENIKRALDAELYFYGKVFGFEPADEIEPVDIKNLNQD